MFASLAALLVVVWFVAGAWLVAGALWPGRAVPVPSSDRAHRRRDV